MLSSHALWATPGLVTLFFPVKTWRLLSQNYSRRMTGPALLVSYTWAWFTLVFATRVSSTVLPRLDTGCALPSATVSEQAGPAPQITLVGKVKKGRIPHSGYHHLPPSHLCWLTCTHQQGRFCVGDWHLCFKSARQDAESPCP